MAVHIQTLKDHEILVNDKLVVQDSDGNWNAKIELTNEETKAFQSYIATRMED